MTEIADKIIEYRAKENISMQEMAKRCNVTVQTIRNIETEIQDPSRLTLKKIMMVIEEGEK